MIYFLLGFVCFCIIMKLVFKLTNGVCRSSTCLIGKTVLITGGNSGIGYETALGLAARGCRLIIASRSCDNQQAAAISQATGNPFIIAKKLDLSSFASVRKFAADLLATEARLDILVNNSGTAGLGNLYTEDGLQMIMQINHYGPFLLTHLLIPLLKKSSRSRIIFNSSMLAFTNSINIIDNLNNPYKTKNANKNLLIDFCIYSNSKLCNIISTRYFAKKLRETGITCNATHPGVVNTKIYFLAITSYMPKFFAKLFYAIFGFILKDPFEGAQTILHLALSEDLENVSGKYFWDCIQFFLPSAAKNQHVCKTVIEESIKLVKLSENEML